MKIETIDVPLYETAKTRYLNYAMSVITSRALPDVRDGLKPVQRRILYAMFHELKLTHDAKHRKSAAVVGEVMAKYHPHGDSSIYEAMVRMAQSFSLRYPLVDGQGNFGSIDGDSAAAMRYTEARMTSIASELINEIKKETVEFRPTYDAEHEEPLVLPTQVPNLLINGSTGIAVGMSTNIPPHNLGEVLDALIALIDNRELSVDDIVGTYIFGPDFPTGCNLLNDIDSLKEIYQTGSGPIELRVNWEIETENKTNYIIITSVPYGVSKDDLVQKIAEHIMKENVPQLVDIRDESTDDIRIVLELKKDANPDPAMAYLFKHTALQTKFHVNFTCLVPSIDANIPTPAKPNLVEMLNHFLDFRKEIVTRRLNYDLRKLLERIHILEGFEIIFDQLDLAIKIIRESEGRAQALKNLCKHFSIDAIQADAVLDLRLYRLAKLEIGLILQELAEKRAEAARIQAILDSPEALWSLIKDEFFALRSAYGDSRRTLVDAPVKELDYSEEDYIVDENCILIVTENGWVKRQKSYTDLSSIRVREGDEVRWVLPGRTPNVAVFFSNFGTAYSKRLCDIVQTSGHGDPMQSMFSFNDGEKIVGVIIDDPRVILPVAPEPKLAQASLDGSVSSEQEEKGDGERQCFAMNNKGQAIRFSVETLLEPSSITGRRYMRLDPERIIINVEPLTGNENIAIATRDGRGMMIEVRDINFVNIGAKGSRAILLEGEDEILDFTLCKTPQDGLSVETNRGAVYVIRSTKSCFQPTKRGKKGKWIVKRGSLVKSLRPPVEISADED